MNESKRAVITSISGGMSITKRGLKDAMPPGVSNAVSSGFGDSICGKTEVQLK